MPVPDIPAAAQRRRAAAMAGHKGDAVEALRLSGDSDAKVRATAYGALARAGTLDADALLRGLRDASPIVRRRCAALAATNGERAVAEELVARLRDHDHFVVETAAWACGEWSRENPRLDDTLAALIKMTAEHGEPLCREAAVAALGAIGDERGLDAILLACRDKPAIRRRAVLALAPFDGDAVEAAIDHALKDRDWQVRQAAEDLRR
ncbi:MAG TPA: HEAT repeat domain-containing protein [Acidimicrobiales bacterium]|nr:HEAT repeat domain-containing protein [Acidimicrobiales bacterium]